MTTPLPPSALWAALQAGSYVLHRRGHREQAAVLAAHRTDLITRLSPTSVRDNARCPECTPWRALASLGLGHCDKAHACYAIAHTAWWQPQDMLEAPDVALLRQPGMTPRLLAWLRRTIPAPPPCRMCRTWPGLDDLGLPHTSMGHRVFRRLARQGWNTSRVLRASNEELRDLHGVGEAMFAYLRRFVPDPDKTDRPGRPRPTRTEAFRPLVPEP